MKQLFAVVLVAVVLLVVLVILGPALPAGNPLGDLGRWMARGFGGGYPAG